MEKLQIEKQVLLRAPVARVWQAITDAREFGAWFGVELGGEFEVGRTLTGTWHGEFTEEMINEAQRRAGLEPSKVKFPGPNAVFCTVERLEPVRYFSFRWTPYGIDAEADPEQEEMTLVEFVLEPVADGARLTIVESGFEHIPAHRRERAFRMNTGGWSAQAENLRKYVDV
jgi:uncharacterized protein YndB with AHSA1/START domain